MSNIPQFDENGNIKCNGCCSNTTLEGELIGLAIGATAAIIKKARKKRKKIAE